MSHLHFSACSSGWWRVADGWCWLGLREKYCWLVAGGWFVLREKYCWLVSQANRAFVSRTAVVHPWKGIPGKGEVKLPLEERGDAKLHNLSPRRHTSPPQGARGLVSASGGGGSSGGRREGGRSSAGAKHERADGGGGPTPVVAPKAGRGGAGEGPPTHRRRRQ
jgi:hypothetical protein